MIFIDLGSGMEHIVRSSIGSVICGIKDNELYNQEKHQKADIGVLNLHCLKISCLMMFK